MRRNYDQDGQLDKVRMTLKGRAEKACVRCRAKKRTCDGGTPCQRCKDSHSACYFSDWHYTVPYPREYVEYLEEQQQQLSSGLLTMYRLVKESNIKTVPPLPEKPQAQDLVIALRGLQLDHRQQQQMAQVQQPITNEHPHSRSTSDLTFMSSGVDVRQQTRSQHHVDPGPNPLNVAPPFPQYYHDNHSVSGHDPITGAEILTQIPGSFGSMSYDSFECGRPIVPPPHATSPLGTYPSLVDTRGWQPLSPGASSLSLSSNASQQKPPMQVLRADHNNVIDETMQHWSWHGEGLDVGYSAPPHHSGMSMDMDLGSIERRGEIVPTCASVAR